MNYFSRLVLSLVILLTSGCVLAPVIPGTSEPQPTAVTVTSQPTITVEPTLTSTPVITQTATPVRMRYIVQTGTRPLFNISVIPKSCDWMGAPAVLARMDRRC